MSSTLQQYIDDAKKKEKEEEEKKKAAQAVRASWARETPKDDQAFPTKKAPVADERQEAVQAKRDDVKSLADMAPGTVMFDTPRPAAPSFIPSNFAPAPVQGPAMPTVTSRGPVADAADSWRDKPDRPDETFVPLAPLHPAPYVPPAVGLSFDRPDTGAPALGESQPIQNTIAAPSIGPEKLARPENAAPNTRDFLQANAFRPWLVAPLAVGEGQQPGGLLGQAGQAAGDYLASWLPAGQAQTAGPHGAYGQDAGPAQTAVTDFLWPDTGATANPAWEWWKKRADERAGTFNQGLGDKKWVNPLEHVFDAWTDPNVNTGRYDADQAAAAQGLAERQQNAALALNPLAPPTAHDEKPRDYSYQPNPGDPEKGLISGPLGALAHNVNRNIAATPGVGTLWRGAGYKAQDFADAFPAADRAIMATRFPTFGADGKLTNDLTVGEVAAAAGDAATAAGANSISNAYTAAQKGDWGTALKELTSATSPAAAATIFKPSAWATFGANLNQNLAAAAQSSTPTMAQVASNTPETVANAQAYVKTFLPYSLPEQRKAALDEMLNKDQNIQQAQATAEQAKAIADNPNVPYVVRQQAAIAAADAGRQIKEYQSQTNQGIVDKHTNILRDGIYTTILDPAGWAFGKIFEVAELTPALRRLAQAKNGVFNEDKDAQILVKLGAMNLGPDVAKAADAMPGLSNWVKADMALVHPAQTKAAMDAQTLYGGIINIVKDADTKEDWRLILQTLARQPEQLVKGLPVNLFSSPTLQNLAGADGLVKWPAAVFGNKGFLDALQGSYRAVADDLPLLESLAGSGPINKLEGADSAGKALLDAFEVGGFRRYGIATEYGAAPLNTVPKLQDLGGGQAVITWLDDAKNVVKTSDKMPLGDATKLLTKLETDGANEVNGVQQWGNSWRSLMSKIWLNARPATTVTNAAGGNLQMFVDGDHSFAPLNEIIETTKRFFGGAIPNARMAEAATAAPMEAKDWLSLAKVRSGTGELAKGAIGVGEQNLAAKAWYGAFQRGFNKMWNRASDVGLSKAYELAGIADPALQQSITNVVKEMGSTGDKAGMVKAVQEILAGKVRAFSVGDLSAVYKEALTPDGLAELNQMLRTAAPGTEGEVAGQITDLIEREATRWQNYLLTDPGQPRRYAWSATEVAQDGADVLRDAEKAIKGGADAAQTKAAAQTIIDQQTQAQKHLEILTQLVADAADPKQRYLLYNVWADIYDSKTAVRMKLGQMVEDVYEAGGNTAWDAFDYFGAQAKAWTEHNQQVEGLIANANKALTSGQQVTPRFDAWSAIERQAGKTIDELRAVMQAEPKSGLWDERLKKSIEAGRAVEDKAVARAYAAARRFNVPDAMDFMTAAERDSQHFGAQANAYVRKSFDTIVRPKLGKVSADELSRAYDEFYAIRNQVQRELRNAQYERWDSATRQIVGQGVGQGLAGGLQFDLGGIMGKVTLVGPGQGEHAGEWAVTTASGALQYLPAEGEKTAAAIKNPAVSEGFAGAASGAAAPSASAAGTNYSVPGEAIERYKKLAQESDTQVAMEMDNIASALPFIDEAKTLPTPAAPATLAADVPFDAKATIERQGGKTATELANAKRAEQARLAKPIQAGDVHLQFESADDQTLYTAGGPPGDKKAARARDELYKSGKYPGGYPEIKTAAADMREEVKAIRTRYKASKTADVRYGPGGSPIVDVPAQRSKVQPLLSNAVQEKIGAAQDSVKGLAEARDTMRTQWDRQASATWQLPSLDSLIARYERKGVVNVPENMFEDLYGATIAGYKLDGQADVEAMLTEYAQIKRQAAAATQAAEGSAATMADLHSIAASAGVVTTTGAGNINDQYLLNAVNAERKLQGMKPITIEQLTRDPNLREEAAELLMNRIGPGEGPTIHGPDETPEFWSKTKDDNLLNLGNLKNDDAKDMHTVVEDLTQKVGQAGNYGHVQLSDAAQRQLEVLRNLERALQEKLPAILQAPGAQLAPGQQLTFMDNFLREVMPYYDKAVQAAGQYGDAMQSYTMIDMSNNTHLDNIVALAVPYHHWYSRSIKNAVERMIFQPGLTSKMANEQRLIELENQQSNVAPRDQGTIPFTVGGTTYRMRTGVDRYIPFLPSFIQNDYANPEEANNALSFATETMKVGNFGIYPWIDAAANAFAGKGNQFYLPGMLGPYATLAADALQAGGVQVPQSLQRPNNDYLIGREAFRMYAEGFKVGDQPVSKYEAQMVQDYERMTNSGEQPLPEMLPMMDRIKAIQAAASSRVGKEKLLNNATGFLTNAPLYSEYQSEKDAYSDQQAYYGRRYGPDNPYGSKLAADAQSPYQSPYSTRANVTNLDEMRPAQDAVNDAYSAEYKQINEAMHAATEAYIRSHPNAPTDEVSAVTAPFYAQMQALKDKYPSQTFESSGGVPKGMNPQERAEWQTNQIVRGPVPGGAVKPTYPEGGTPAELRTYYEEFAKWQALKNQQITGDINQVYGDQGDPPSDWTEAFKQMNRGKLADDLYRDTYLQNYSEVERAWNKQKHIEQASSNEEFKASQADIARILGTRAAAEWQAYLDLPKGSDERKAYAASHPNIAKAKIAGYNPAEYQQAQKLFGADAWDVLAGAPDYPKGDNLSDAVKQAYYDKLNAYNKLHPAAPAIKLWVNGRSKWSDYASTTDTEFYNDFGKDYAQAMQIFGPNIFKTIAATPKYVDTKAGKAAYFDYMHAHPEIYAFQAWQAEFKEAPENAGELPRLDLAHLPATAAPNASMLPDESVLHRGETPIGQPPGAAPTPGPDMAGAQTMPLAMPKAAASPVTWGNPNKTMMQYAQDSEGYQKGLASNAKYAAGQAAYAARRQGVVTEFGEEAAASWEAYGNLPKGSKAREDYRAAHPELKAYDMAAYNPEQYAAAKKLFGDSAWLDWARTPKADDTDAGKVARAAYLDAHPMAKLMAAWVYGRPSGTVDAGEPGETGFSYNFGADFAAAQKQFGDDIWSIYLGYKGNFDKSQKKAYFDKYPQLSEFFGWWYGNDKSAAAGQGQGYGRGYGGGYGGGFGGYGGGGGGGGAGHVAKIDPRYMDKNLIITDQDLRNNAAHQWRPHNIDLRWMHAGDAIGPDNLKKWKR